MLSPKHRFQLNVRKGKDIRISFTDPAFPPIITDDVVPSVKLLDLNISNKSHIAEISKKVSIRLYFLRQLKRANVVTFKALFYTICIRPVMVLLYACAAFHHGLPEYLSNELESLQKRALRIFFLPFLSSRDANQPRRTPPCYIS